MLDMHPDRFKCALHAQLTEHDLQIQRVLRAGRVYKGLKLIRIQFFQVILQIGLSDSPSVGNILKRPQTDHIGIGSGIAEISFRAGGILSDADDQPDIRRECLGKERCVIDPPGQLIDRIDDQHQPVFR